VIFGGARNGLGATLRAHAYTAASQLFVILPAIGIFLAMGWWFVLADIGLRVVHGTSTGRALAAIVLPVLPCFPPVLVRGVVAALLTLAASRAPPARRHDRNSGRAGSTRPAARACGPVRVRSRRRRRRRRRGRLERPQHVLAVEHPDV